MTARHSAACILCLFVACIALLLWQDAKASAADGAVSPAGQTATESPFEIEIVGLPGFVYEGEQLSFSVRIANTADETAVVAVAYKQGARRMERKGTVAGKSESLTAFPLIVKDAAKDITGEISVRVVAQRAAPLWKSNLIFRNALGDLEGLTVAKRRYYDTSGAPVILVNSYEDQTDYRRWALVKWALQARERSAAKRLLWAPEELIGLSVGEELDDSKALKPPLAGISFIPYEGRPLEALLSLEKHISGEDAVLLAIGWGFHEAFERVPVRDLIRALDVTIDRARGWNSSCRIVLLTPPPLVGEEDVSGAHADAIRALAREHHTAVIDIHAKMLAENNWQTLYALDGDMRVFGLYPSEAGRSKIRAWIAEGLE